METPTNECCSIRSIVCQVFENISFAINWWRLFSQTITRTKIDVVDIIKFSYFWNKFIVVNCISNWNIVFISIHIACVKPCECIFLVVSWSRDCSVWKHTCVHLPWTKINTTRQSVYKLVFTIRSVCWAIFNSFKSCFCVIWNFIYIFKIVIVRRCWNFVIVNCVFVNSVNSINCEVWFKLPWSISSSSINIKIKFFKIPVQKCCACRSCWCSQNSIILIISSSCWRQERIVVSNIDISVAICSCWIRNAIILYRICVCSIKCGCKRSITIDNHVFNNNFCNFCNINIKNNCSCWNTITISFCFNKCWTIVKFNCPNISTIVFVYYSVVFKSPTNECVTCWRNWIFKSQVKISNKFICWECTNALVDIQSIIFNNIFCNNISCSILVYIKHKCCNVNSRTNFFQIVKVDSCWKFWRICF